MVPKSIQKRAQIDRKINQIKINQIDPNNRPPNGHKSTPKRPPGPQDDLWAPPDKFGGPPEGLPGGFGHAMEPLGVDVGPFVVDFIDFAIELRPFWNRFGDPLGSMLVLF